MYIPDWYTGSKPFGKRVDDRRETVVNREESQLCFQHVFHDGKRGAAFAQLFFFFIDIIIIIGPPDIIDAGLIDTCLIGTIRMGVTSCICIGRSGCICTGLICIGVICMGVIIDIIMDLGFLHSEYPVTTNKRITVTNL